VSRGSGSGVRGPELGVRSAECGVRSAGFAHWAIPEPRTPPQTSRSKIWTRGHPWPGLGPPNLRVPNPDSRGFTLLEVMIALAILATLMVILLAGFRIGISAWAQGEERAEIHQHLRSLSELFYRSLNSAYPYKARPKEGEEPLVLFQGAADEVSFVTLTPPFPGEASIAFTAVRFTFQQGAESGLAVRQKLLPNEEPFGSFPALLVDPEVVGVAFKYQNASGEWEESWDGAAEKKIPLAVQIELQRRVRGRVESLAPLTIALQASQP